VKLVIKHRYRHTDPDTGMRVETRHRMTAEAAAASAMIDPELIAESREERYVQENPNQPQFGPHFSKAPKR
jgi:hypothetical protein